MKIHKIIICANAETVAPIDLPEWASDTFEYALENTIDAYKSSCNFVEIEKSRGFREWNGGKYSHQRRSLGWNGGTAYVVCRTDAPEEVYDECFKIQAYLDKEFDKFVKGCLEESADD